MKYFCIIFVFLAIFLYGCSNGGGGLSSGPGPERLNITITVVDQNDKPYAQVPVTLRTTLGHNVEYTSDNDGMISVENIPIGQCLVMLYHDPEINDKINVISGVQNYTAVIARSDVSNVLFDLKLVPDRTLSSESFSLLKCGEEINNDPYLLWQNSDKFWYPRLTATIQAIPIPEGSYYVYGNLYDSSLHRYVEYVGDIFSVARGTQFPLTVTLNADIHVNVKPVNENGTHIDFSYASFENVETGKVFYVHSRVNDGTQAYSLPTAGTYIMSIPFSDDKYEVTTGEPERVLSFKRLQMERTGISFKILDSGHPIPSTTSPVKLNLAIDSTVSYNLTYDSVTGTWILPSGGLILSDLYRINFGPNFAVSKNRTYPITVNINDL